MKKIKVAVYVSGLVALAACHNGGNSPSATAEVTTSKTANSLIDNNTDETSSPIAINDVPLTSDETDETSSPVPI